MPVLDPKSLARLKFVSFSSSRVHGALESWNIGDAPFHKRLAELLWLLTTGGPSAQTLALLRDITVEHASMLEATGLVKRKDLFHWEYIRPSTGAPGELQMCAIEDPPGTRRIEMGIEEVYLTEKPGTISAPRGPVWCLVGILPVGTIPEDRPLLCSKVHILSRGVWASYKAFNQLRVTDVDQLRVTYEVDFGLEDSKLQVTDVWDLVTLDGPPDSLLPGPDDP